MRSISSRQNPIVRTFRDLAGAPPDDGRRLLLDGLHLLEEARTSDVTIETVAIAETLLESEDARAASLVSSLERMGTDVIAVTNTVMSALSPVREPSGVVAIAERTPTPAATIYAHPNALVLAAVDVQDPGNVGALVRTAEALGATGVVVCGASANPFSWKALRGSMGSALRLPLAVGGSVRDVLNALRTSGVTRIASVPRDGRSPAAVSWSGRVAIVVGGEGAGLEAALIAQCDERVTIPMRPPVESLNVAVAGALLLYEARRHRV